MAAPIVTGASGAAPWIADHVVATAAQASDMVKRSAFLDDVLSAELAGAQHALGSTIEELLLAVLGRTVARVIGGGLLTVDMDPAADDLGVVGSTLAVPCVSKRGLSGSELLAAGHGAGGGDLRGELADIAFCYGDMAPTPTGEHVLALHVDHQCLDDDRVVRLDWWYDRRSFDHHTIEELADQFPLALIEVTSG